MIFDTDVVIWALRGASKAARVIDREEVRVISVVTYMELIQGARGRNEITMIRDFITDCGFSMLPLTENIGHRASVYMEEYALKSGLSMANALIAATATEHSDELCTANQKHFRAITELRVKPFRPGR